MISSGLPPFYGGAEMRAFRMADRLNRSSELEVRLVGWDRGSDGSRSPDFPAFVVPISLRFHGRGGIPSKLLHLLETRFKFERLFRRLSGKVDLVHSFNPSSFFSLVAVLVARRRNIPTVIEMTLLGSDDPLKLLRRRSGDGRQGSRKPLKYRLFSMADAYVSKSTGLSDAYREAGLPDVRLHQIPIGVDTDLFSPLSPEGKRALRTLLGWPEDAGIILFAGGIERRKGLHVLLDAFARAAAMYQSSLLVLAGPVDRFEQGYIEELEAAVDRNGLADRVIFTRRFVENIHQYMQAADIFALASDREGMPNALLEAMAAGLGIVASDIPGITDLKIEDDVDGFLIPPGDCSRLSAALLELLNSPEKRERMGRSARARAVHGFSQKAIDGRYADLYKRLAVRP